MWRRLAASSLFIGMSLVQAAPALPADAQAFVGALREAAARPGGSALAELAELPFLFEGRPRGRDEFVARVVPALFDAPVRRCLQHAVPQPEGDRLVLWCRPYAFYLGPVQGRWRLIEFAADAE